MNRITSVFVVVILASFVGPLLATILLPAPHSFSVGWENLNGLATRLWPTRFLALGTPEISTKTAIWLILANTLFHILILLSSLSVIYFTRRYRIGTIYIFLLLFAFPQFLLEFWYSRFNVGLINCTSFVPALLYYVTVSVLLSRLWRFR